MTPMTQTWRLVCLDAQLQVVTGVPLDRRGAEALAVGWAPGVNALTALTAGELARLGRILGSDVTMPPARAAATIVATGVADPAGAIRAVSGLTSDAGVHEGDGATVVMPPI